MALQLLSSPLHDRHVALGAKFAEFGGWSMPLEYPAGRGQGAHRGARAPSASSTSATSARSVVRGAGAAAYVNATLTNDLGRIAPGQGAVHAVLRRRDRRRRRRPDRLLPRRRPRAARPQRGQHRRGRAPARRGGARGRRRSSTTTATHAVLAVQGPRVRRGARRRSGCRPGTTTCPSSRPTFEGADVVVCRTGYTGERGYELVATNAVAVAAVGRAAGGRRAARACCRAASAPATRCAPRWATRCTARTSASTSRPNQARPRLGGRLEEGRVLGHGRRWSPRRRPGPTRLLRGLVAAGAASRGPGCACCSTARRARRARSPPARSPRPCARASRWRWSTARSSEGAEVSVDVRGRREVFVVTKPPFV